MPKPYSSTRYSPSENRECGETGTEEPKMNPTLAHLTELAIQRDNAHDDLHNAVVEAAQTLSYADIARAVGLTRVTVRAWAIQSEAETAQRGG